MAYVKNIPIYTSAYQYTREIYRLKSKLPKVIKNDLGKECTDSVLKIINCIVLANKSLEKLPHLNRLILEKEVQWLLSRLLFDLKGISSGELKVLSERLGDIEKQEQAWTKWEKENTKKKN